MRPSISKSKGKVYLWAGTRANGQTIKGELHAPDADVATMALQRQGIIVTTIKKQVTPRQQRMTDKDIAVFTRQLATMFKAGIPILQAFAIIISGQHKASLAAMLTAISADIETGTSLHAAFRKYPAQFNDLYCNLIAAGETAGMLDQLLERLASYKEKTLAMQYKMRTAIVYPASILIIALIVTIAIMLFVIPAFKTVFANVGADLPGPTLVIIALSDMMVNYGLIILLTMGIGCYAGSVAWKRSSQIQTRVDKLLLHLPVFGLLIKKAIWSRWSRTLATLCVAGVPIIDALTAVGPTCGNLIYQHASDNMRRAVNDGVNLSTAMETTELFPYFILQMVSVGEESGTLDQMLNKVADFYETEVDETIATMSTLFEPVIIVLLGLLIGGLVIALYLPIFKLGTVV